MGPKARLETGRWKLTAQFHYSCAHCNAELRSTESRTERAAWFIGASCLMILGASWIWASISASQPAPRSFLLAVWSIFMASHLVGVYSWARRRHFELIDEAQPTPAVEAQ
jgi:hypothetical protein